MVNIHACVYPAPTFKQKDDDDDNNDDCFLFLFCERFLSVFWKQTKVKGNDLQFKAFLDFLVL